MPSPFPGMDPFIEGQRWRDFHTSFITVIREMLMPQVRPRYVVEVEEYVYLAREDAATLAPVIHTVPVPRHYRQAFLNIRNRQSQNVVTVIELLSPWNKTAGEGRNEYMVKRSNIFHTPAHLVELDLLRGGQRLPTREPLEPADYHAFVCRRERLPKIEVYSWTMRDPLPAIPVPLAGGDPDVSLDLQAAFTTTYDRAGYDYALDYRRPVEPPPEESAAEWVRSVLEP